MRMTFRWYGKKDDKITLQQIQQIPGMDGIVGALFDVPVGEVWPLEDLLSIKEDALEGTINKYSSINTFVIDLDRTNKEHICTDVLYLIEPSTIKLNKLSLINPKVFSELKGKNVILNKSLLNDSDIANFEVESNLKVFYNMPPLNDKEDVSKYILPLLEKLGYIKVQEETQEESPKKSIFSIFKKK